MPSDVVAIVLLLAPVAIRILFEVRSSENAADAASTDAARYCVIGAGAAGLGALQVIRDAGLSVECIEQTDRVGGHWHTDYHSLHLITPRDSSGYDGFPMPSEYPVFPSRDQMRDYILAYASHHNLAPSISFNTAVSALRPLGRAGLDGWEVTTTDGTSRDYQGVIVANGHLWDPLVPDIPGGFSGPVLHSKQYHVPDDLAGQRVLVVGAGNSGCDVAVDAAQAGKDTYISVRRGQVFQPKTLFGRPRSELPMLGRLPIILQERLTRLLVDVSVGRPELYGLPSPSTRNLHRNRPVVNSLLLHYIHHGRVHVVPEVESFDDGMVRFVDGSKLQVDTIVLATGFKVTIPFLEPSHLNWEHGVPLRVAGLTLPLRLARLYFVGLAAPRGAQLPVYSAQSRLVVRLIEAQRHYPFPLAELFSRHEQPDARIDIVRHEWLRQMQRADRRVSTLLRRARGRSASGGRAGASRDGGEAPAEALA